VTIRDVALLEGLDQGAILDAIKVLRDESDRGAILVAVSVLDGVFENRLRQLLDRGNAEAQARLLKGPLGALSTFSSKVDLAYCIGMIPPQLYGDIRLLKKLRNYCAHHWEEFLISRDVLDRFINPMKIKKALDAARICFPPFRPRDEAVGALAALITIANHHGAREQGSPPKANA
jgi:DNA-binding MltR family transcriptional regulator